MKNIINYKHHKKFICHIVQYLHMDIEDFEERLEQGGCYEQTINNWILKLYKKGVTSEDAIQIIYRARIFMITRNKIGLDSIENSRH